MRSNTKTYEKGNKFLRFYKQFCERWIFKYVHDIIALYVRSDYFMRKYLSIALIIACILSLCACGKKDDGSTERECGVYISLEASDVYTVSCGTDAGSDSFTNADGSALASGSVIHFDFAGDKAEGSAKAEIEYSICIYDAELNVITLKSFTDDFSNMARIDITITADHRIINANAGSCGGDVVVEMSTVDAEDGVSYMVPQVTMPARTDAADTMNAGFSALNEKFTGDTYAENHELYVKNTADGNEDVSAFSMARTIRAERTDSAVVSLRVVDRASLGTLDTLTISGHSYDSQTGAELKLADICDDSEKLVNAVSESILVSFNTDDKYKDTFFNEGYSDTVKSLVADGHWYLSDSGIVIIANTGELADAESGFYEFTVSYDDLSGVIKQEYVPQSREAAEGDVSVDFAANTDSGSLTVLASPASADIKSLILSASGSVYDLTVYTIKYHNDSAYDHLKQVLACSDMSDGAALAINTELSGTTPTMVVEFTLGDGTREVRFLALNEDGSVRVIDPNGSTGTVITSRLPYTGDLNGDGIDETISTVADGEGLTVVNVEVSGSTHEAATPVKTVNSIRLFDVNGDGVREIFLDGKNADGADITCAVLYSPGEAQALHTALFNSQSYADGLIKTFSDGKLALDTKVDILGTYKIKSEFTYSDKAFVQDSGEIVFDNDGTFVTTSASIKLSNGSLLQSGTKLRFTSTDGSSVINFVTDGGFTGSIPIAKSDSGWTIDGKSDTSYFTSLPYKD